MYMLKLWYFLRNFQGINPTYLFSVVVYLKIMSLTTNSCFPCSYMNLFAFVKDEMQGDIFSVCLNTNATDGCPWGHDKHKRCTPRLLRCACRPPFLVYWRSSCMKNIKKESSQQSWTANSACAFGAKKLREAAAVHCERCMAPLALLALHCKVMGPPGSPLVAS